MKTFFAIGSLLLLLNIPSSFVEGTKKVAIIGRTFSGALCAHYLHKLIPNNIQIDFYDDNPNTEKYKIIKFHSIFHQYIEEILSIEGIISKPLYPNGNLIMSDGSDSDNKGYWTIEKLKRQANPKDFEILIKLITSTFDKFQNIYRLQNNFQKKSYEKLIPLIADIDKNFIPYTAIKLGNMKEEFGMNNEDFEYMLDILLIRNYWETNPHVLAALSAFWFSELNGDKGYLKRFSGTSYDVIQTIIKKNGDGIKDGIVEVKSDKNSNIIVTEKRCKMYQNRYDFIIIAKPNDDSKIIFSGFTTNNSPKCKYWPIYMSEVRGTVKNECFGSQELKNDARSVISHYSYDVLTISDENNLIWNINSPNQLSKLVVDKYFNPFIGTGRLKKQVKFVKQIIKTPATVDYSKYECIGETKFVLAKNVYNVNAIEWIGNNSEILAIGAKNVALLIEKEIINYKS